MIGVAIVIGGCAVVHNVMLWCKVSKVVSSCLKPIVLMFHNTEFDSYVVITLIIFFTYRKIEEIEQMRVIIAHLIKGVKVMVLLCRCHPF